MFSICVLFQLQIKLPIHEIKSRKNNLNRNITHDFLWIQHQGDFVKALGELHGHEATIQLDDEKCLGSSCLFSVGSFGGTLVGDIGELTKQNQVYRKELGHLVLFLSGS